MSDGAIANVTPRAQQVLALARKEADRFHHNFVGTEHLLLGMIRLGQGTGFNALLKMGIDVEALRKEVEKTVPQSPAEQIVGNIIYTPRVKKVLALAAKEARQLKHTFLGTEHILLGLLLEGDGVAPRVLKKFEVTIDRARDEILKEVGTGFSSKRIISMLDSVPGKPPISEEAKRNPTFLDRLRKWFAPDSPVKPPGELLSNLTPQAQIVLDLARTEADRFNHNFVGTEHLLLGLTALGKGIAVNVLQKMGLDLETIRMEVEKQVGTGPDQKMIGNIPYTPRLKKVLALAVRESKALNHTYVGTEHILLGLLREGEGVAARVLRNLDVDIERTRQEILKELDPNLPEMSNASTEARLRLSREAQLSSTLPYLSPPHQLTPRAEQVLALARSEADRLKQNCVGTEHLLLGLIRLGQGVAANVLKKLSLDLESARSEVEKQFGPVEDVKLYGKIPYTPRVKKVLQSASTIARSMGHTYIGTEHILLGLLDEKDGPAAKILKSFNVDCEQTRLAIVKEITPNSGGSGPEPTVP